VWITGEIGTEREHEVVETVAALDTSPGTTIELDLSKLARFAWPLGVAQDQS
jgi:hypothetical protein